jgi:TonB family protein
LANEIIPVRIVKEAPGSDDEPAPAAPKVLAPRRNVIARPTAATIVPRSPIAPPHATAPIVPTQAVQMARIDPAAAPTQVVQRQVSSQVVTAQRVVMAPSSSAVHVAATSPVAIAATPAVAPRVPVAGPQRLAPTTAANVAATEVYAAFGEPAASEIHATAKALPSVVPAGSEVGSDFDVQTDFALDTIGSGGGTGGSGASIGTARCLESAYVQRYYQTQVKQRVLARWFQDQAMDDAPPNARAVLRFVLDASGSATHIELVEASDEAVGHSALRAMRAASPFPAMGDDTRCLAGKKLRAIFSVPSSDRPDNR